MAMLEEKGIQADADYQEYALRALTRYVEIHGKEKSFGNARYVRTEFLPDSLDAQTDRLIRQYGEDFPRELKQQLTGADHPSRAGALHQAAPAPAGHSDGSGKAG